MKTSSFMLIASIIVACSQAYAYTPPFNLSKFHAVLLDSKLQAPDSNAVVQREKFNGFADSFFYLDNNCCMTFKMSDASKRSELRQLPEWQTSTPTWRKLIGRVKVFYPIHSPSLNQISFVQIHDSGSYPNKPLLRLVWIRSRSDLSDHLWAVIRSSVAGGNYQYIDLGIRPSGFFQCEVKVKNNKLTVKLNGVTKINNANVAYWSSFRNYYKAGVYLQDAGEAKVQFDSLKYYYQ